MSVNNDKGIVLTNSKKIKKFSTLLDCLDFYAVNTPSKVAYTCLKTIETAYNITYEELKNESLCVARRLSKNGKPGDRVLLLMENSIEYVTSFWGCLYAGMIAVPLPAPQSNNKQHRLISVVEDCAPSLLIVHPDHVGRLNDVVSEAVSCLAYQYGDWSEPGDGGIVTTIPSATAFIQYSSGSTGKPKGAAITHNNLIDNARTLVKFSNTSSQDVFVSWLPFFHDMGLMSEVVWPLYLGAHSVFLTPTRFMRNPYFWLNAISHFRGNVSCAPNFAYEYCAAKITDTNLIEALDLSAWRFALNGAEPVKHKTLEQFFNVFQAAKFDPKAIVPAYGMAEATVFVSGHFSDEGMHVLQVKTSDFQERRIVASDAISSKTTSLVSCGTPPDNHEVIIVDEQTLQPLKDDRIGEIWIRSDNVSSGYWGRESLNETVFNAYTIDGHGPYFRSGDMGFIHQKALFITSRINDIIIVNGKNIFANDIEAVASECLPNGAMSQIAAIGVDNDGSEDVLLLLEVKKGRSKHECEVLAKQIATMVLERCDVVLKSILMVTHGTLAKTTSGKIKRKQIKQQLLSDELSVVYSLQDTESQNEPSIRFPANQVEEKLIAIWEELLGRSITHRNTNFLHSGGTSLSVNLMISQVLEEWGVELELSRFYASPLIGDTANAITNLLAQTDKNQTAKSVSNKVQREDISTSYPLSMQQKGMWLTHNIEGDKAKNNIFFAFKISGQLNVNALQAACEQIVNWNESFRTRYFMDNGVLQQQVRAYKPEQLNFTIHDLSESDELHSQEQLEQIIFNEQCNPFDLDCDILFRVTVVSVDSAVHYVLFSMHHIAADGWSTGVFIKQLNGLYHSFYHQWKLPFSSPDVQYKDYANEQHARNNQPEEVTHFWNDYLRDAPHVHHLPLDHRRTKEISFQGGEYVSFVAPEWKEILIERCRQQNATLFMGMYAIFNAFLFRYTGEHDQVIGAPVANRESRKFHEVLGCFINVLPLRTHVDDNQCFDELLVNAKQQCLQAFSHQQITLAEVIEVIQPERSGFYQPLVQILLDMQNNETVNLALPETTCELLHKPLPYTLFDLSLEVTEKDKGIEVKWLFNSALFNTSSIAKMATHFHQLLQTLITSPNDPLASIDLLSSSERKQLLMEFNSRQTAFQHPIHTLNSYFEAQVKEVPDATAVVHNGVSLTYAEINALANQLAQYLIEKGVTIGERVGIYAKRSSRFLIGMLAALKAGGAYVPLDPVNPRGRLERMLKSAQVKVLLSESSCIEQIRVPEDASVFLLDADRSCLDAYPQHNPDVVVSPDNLAYMIYTSGTTGEPKGVLIHHKGALNHIQAAFDELGFCDQNGGLLPRHFLQTAASSSDVSVWQFLAPLMCGGKTVIVDDSTDMPAVIKAIRDEQVNILEVAPVVLQLLIDYVSPRSNIELSLDALITTGEAVPITPVNKWLERFPLIPIVNGYGPSEASDDITFHFQRTPLDPHAASLPIGKSLPNLAMYVVNSQLQLQPVGVVGELCVSGVQVGLGYWNNPSMMAKRFLANPYAGESGNHGEVLYRTGDMGFWREDGSLMLVGRKDRQIQVRGHRVELGEVEAAIDSIDGIDEAAVTVSRSSSGDEQLVAYMVKTPNSSISVACVRSTLEGNIPRHMIPGQFVYLDEMPLNAADKIDYEALPSPDEFVQEQTYYEAPRGETETLLASVWQALFSVDDVSRHEHFFDFGGHSLLIVKMMTALQNNGLNLTVNQVFEFPVLKDLAAAITVNAEQPYEPIPNLIAPDTDNITPEMLPLVNLTQAEIDLLTAQCPGGVSNIEDIYPLGPLQEGLLYQYLSLEAEQGDPYVVPKVLPMKDRSDAESYINAVNKVIMRHEVLRTAIFWDGLAQPVQVVLREAALTANEYTLSSASELPQQIKQHIAPGLLRLDLRSAPLMRVDMLHVENSDQCFIVIYQHHIINDNVGLALLLREIEAHLRAEKPDLAPVTPYREFIAHTLLLNENTEGHRYFSHRFSDVDEPTLPFGITDIQVAPEQIREVSGNLSVEMSTSLRQICQERHVSPASLFHLVWALVVGRLSGRDDVIFGTVLSGRMQGTTGAANTIGLFINTLPIRLNLGADVGDALQQAHSELLSLLTFEQTPLSKVRELTELDNEAPIFTSILNYRTDDSAHASQGERIEQNSERDGENIDLGYDLTNFPLDISIDDRSYGLFGIKVQALETIDGHQILAYVQESVKALLSALENNPTQATWRLNIMPVAERVRLLAGFNDTQASYPQDVCIHELFEEQALKSPESVALVYEGETLSYLMLNQKANQIAHYLVSQGVKPDTLVALCVERSFDLVIGLLAIMKAGGAYVPIDPGYPEERIAFLLSDSGASVVLTQSYLTDKLPLNQLHKVCMDAADQDCIVQQSQINLKPSQLGLTSSHLAYVIYTSGTTGLPKGVMVEHNSVINYLISKIKFHGTSTADRLLAVTTISFDPHVMDFFLPLLCGAQVHIADQNMAKDARAIEHYIDEHNITIMQATLSVWRSMCDFSDTHFSSLKAFMGGEKLQADLAEKLTSKVGEIWNLYGLTETTVWSTHSHIQNAHDNISVGTAFANTCIYILDPHGQPAPLGVTGDIYIGGAGITRGYMNRPELTEQRFVPDPFSSNPDARLYKTGDLGFWQSDGNLQLVGRNDHQVKVRGFRVELGEIEAQLKQLVAINNAVVVAYGTESHNRQLVGYITLEEHQKTDDAFELLPVRQALSEALPDYMVPGHLMVLDTLPLTPNGKIDRSALPRPDESTLVQARYEEPAGETEMILAQIWRELLDVRRISRHDSFFALGGHSLLAVRFISQVQKRLHRELPLATLFEQPILKDLAHILDAAQFAVQAVITPQERTEHIPVSWAQQRLWFISQLEGGSEAYHMPHSIAFDGTVSVQAFRSALETLVARHEPLRTVFREIDGEPVQVIQPADNNAFCLDIEDLSHLSEPAQQAALAALTHTINTTPFDLENGPLFRAQLVRLTADSHVLLVNMHHIVSDGWSMNIIVQEVNTLYRAYLDGQENPLPALSVQYADYAVWQRKHLTGGVLESQASYWQEHLADVPALLSLPTDYPRPERQSYRGRSVPVGFNPDLTGRIEALANAQGLTVQMVMLAAWSLLLSRLSGQSQVVIGTPVANRRRHEVEALVGFFVNTLALKVDLNKATDVSSLLAQVKDITLSGYAHQDIPFEQVVERLQPARSMSYSPVFQVLFDLFYESIHEVPVIPETKASEAESLSEDIAVKYDIRLVLTVTSKGIEGELEYASDLFDEETIRRHAGYFERLVAAMLNSAGSNDALPVQCLDFMPLPERQQLLISFNTTQTDYPEEKCIHELFEAQVAQTPDAIALVCEGETMTYQTLNQRANQLAHYLIAQGVKPDALVGLCMKRSLEMVIGVLGILKAGGAYVPVDPTYPQSRIAFLLSDSEVNVVVTQTDLCSQLPTDGIQLFELDNVYAEIKLSMQPDSNPDKESNGLTSSHSAYVIYTSGTTGKPKGVLVSHKAATNYLIHAVEEYFNSTVGAVVSTALSFDATVTSLLGPLAAGRFCQLLGDGHVEHELTALLRALSSAQAPMVFKLTPGHLTALGAYNTSGEAFTQIAHHLVVGGESLDMSLAKAWTKQYCPEAILFNEYGPTEATVGCSLYRITGNDMHVHDDLNIASVPIGRPLMNTQLYVVDSYLQPVPAGVPGELLIGGAGLAKGYLNQATMTQEKFVANPFGESNELLYRTGDIVRMLPNGHLAYLGRNDQQVKIRGFRIELGEIQAQLQQQDGIQDAFVVAYDTDNNDKQLVGYVTLSTPLADGESSDLTPIRQALSGALPDYMVPSNLMVLKAFPLTRNGKIDRKALPEPDDSALAQAKYEAPVGDTEVLLAEIWQDLLGVNQVGRYDNFFALGGHSLLIIRLISELQSRGLNLNVSKVFDQPVLMELAVILLNQQDDVFKAPPNMIPAGCTEITPEMLPLFEMSATGNPLTPGNIQQIVEHVPGGLNNIQDIYPLAPLQEGILFHHQLTEHDVYISYFTGEVSNEQRLHQVLDALQVLIDRHDVLRTLFLWQHLPQPVQVVCRQAELRVTKYTVASEQEARQQLEALVEPVALHIDVEQAPLLHVQVIMSPDSERCFIALQYHHLIMDHVSEEILLEEIQAVTSGQLETLTAPFHYRNFVAHALSQVSSDGGTAYFRKQLGDIDEVTAPFNLTNVQGDGLQIREAFSLVDTRLSQRIRGVCRTRSVTPVTFFHMLWGLVVGQCSGRSEVVFGTMMSGRLQGTEGAGRTFGMFLNMLPIRLSMTDVSVNHYLEQTHARLLELLPFEQIPLTTAQNCSGLPKGSPLFSAILNYRHSGKGVDTAGPQDSSSLQTVLDGVEEIAGYERGNYPFDCSVDDYGIDFGITLQIDNSIEVQSIMEYMLQTLNKLLLALENDPHCLLNQISILPETERQQLLAYHAQPALPSQTAFATVHEAFEAQARQYPDTPALIHHDTVLSYATLNAQASQLARYLQTQDDQTQRVSPGDVVGLYLPRSPELFMAMLAVMKAGGVWVILDVDNPVSRLTRIVQEAQPVCILSSQALLQESGHSEKQTEARTEEPTQGQLFCHPTIALDDPQVSQGIAAQSPENLSVALPDRAPAFVYFTSGSTGVPKGALNSHQGILSTMQAMAAELALTPQDRVLQFAPTGFDVLTEEVFPAWFSGAAVVLRDEEGLLTPSGLQAMLGRLEVTVCELMAGYWSLWVEALVQQGQRPPSSLRAVMLGSDKVSMVPWPQWQAWDIPVINVFGLTETGCTSLTYRAQGPQPYRDSLPNGRALPQTRVYVLDDNGHPVPHQVEGELYIGGPGVGLGYLNQPEFTAQRFVTFPDGLLSAEPADAGLLYKTGDRARWLADGQLEYLGRQDEQVKIRGFRIEPGEVDAQLLSDPGVARAVTVADKNAGGDVCLVSYVILHGEQTDTQALRTALQSQLPDYMVSAHIMVLDAFPLTASGKIDKKALPKPDGSTLSRTRYEAPVGRSETILAGIWQELLGVDVISRHDSFFALGGHSLLVIRLIARLQEKGLNLKVSSVFDLPILRELAGELNSASETVFEAPVNLIRPESKVITPDMLPLFDLQAEGNPLTQAHVDYIVQQIPGGVTNVEDIYPLGPLQEGMLFHHLASDKAQGDTYITPMVLPMANRKDADRFITALNQVIVRHDVLRTAIFWDGLPQAVQVVLREAKVVVNEMVLPSNEDVVDQIKEIVSPETLWMDLNQAPILRVDMIALPRESQCYVVVYEHHIINDHIGLALLVKEIDAYLADEKVKLSAPMPYRQFVAHALTVNARAETRQYFIDRFGDMDEPTLPYGISDVQILPEKINKAEKPLDAELSNRLRQCCQRNNVSTASLIHLAWGIMIGRLSGREDVVFGSVMSGRLQGIAGAERTIGLFINTLPVRLQLSDTVTDALLRAHDQLLSLVSHEQTLLSTVRECTSLSSEAPMFTSVVNYNHEAIYGDEFADKGAGQITFSGEADDENQGVMELGGDKIHHPLALIINDWGEGSLNLKIQTTDDIGTWQVMGYFCQTLEAAVTALMSDTPAALKQLEILPENERNQLLVEFNETHTAFPDDKCIHELFEEQALRTPEGIALLFEGQTLTYTDVNQRANRLAHFLTEQGVTPDTLVGLCVERSFETVIGILGILKAGGAYLPIDPDYPQERIDYLLSDSDVEMIVTQTHLSDKLKGTSHRLIELDEVYTELKISMCSSADLNRGKLGVSASHLAYVIYTSGTTGKPKGCLMCHRGLVNLALAQSNAMDIDCSSKVLQLASVSFDVATKEWSTALIKGACLVIPSAMEKRDHQLLSELVQTSSVTHAAVLPSFLSLLKKEQWQSIKVFMVGGEPLPLSLAQSWVEGRTLVNEFGPTETTVCSGMEVYRGNVDHITIGRPLQNVQYYVVDPNLNLVPNGVAGELLIGGVGLSRGYLNKPEATKVKFIANPFYERHNPCSSEKVYRTGDLVRYLPNGQLEFVGRNDHQVKIRGFRIELGEIETQLRKHQDINDALVMVYESDTQDKQLVGYVTPDTPRIDSDGVNLASVRQALFDALPDYMSPNRLIVLASFPLTANGKIDRKSLPKPDDTALVQAKYETPIGETEQVLADIWKTLLNVQVISRHDSFFALGGHSLLAVKLISQIQHRLNRQLPLATLFEQPELKRLAYVIDASQFAVQEPIISVQRTQRMPVSWAQQRLWFFAQLESESTAYHIPATVYFDGNLSVSALNAALDTLVVRHEPLRTVFREFEGQPVQVVQSVANDPFALEIEDLSQLSGIAQSEALNSLKQTIDDTPFDLQNGPLFRVKLVKLATQVHILLVNMHHIATDEWSMKVIVNDLNKLYQAYLDGQDNPLPQLSIQYADYAAWQRTHLTGDVLKQQANYWQQQLSDTPPLISLPTDYPRPERPDFCGGMAPLGFDKSLFGRIETLTQRYGMTIQMVMLAAWSILLSRLSGQSQVVIGVPVANRQRPELEELVGFFVNTLALKIDLQGSTDIRSLLTQVKDVALGGYAHQDIPFEQVVELLQPERSLSYSPVFQVMFNLDHDTQADNIAFSDIDTSKTLQGEPAEQQTPFDLTLNLTVTTDGLRGGLEYATGLFEHSTMCRWAEYYESLVEMMVTGAESDASMSIHRLNFLSDAERQQILLTYNQQQELPEQASFVTVHGAFETQAQTYPDNIALIHHDTVLSYATLNSQANQLACYLRTVGDQTPGVSPGDVVGLYLTRSPELLRAMLAVMKAGGVWVILDVDNPVSRLTRIVQEAQPVCILSSQALLQEAGKGEGQSEGQVFSHLAIPLDDPQVSQRIAAQPQENLSVVLPDRAPAFVYFTSGSTGVPKGALNSHQGILSTMQAMAAELALTPQDRVLQFAPTGFDVLTEEVFPAWFSGAAVVLRDEEGLLTPSGLQAMLARLEVTVCELMAGYWSLWVEALVQQGQRPPSSLRAVMLGSEKVSMVHWPHWQAWDIPVINVFGLTETGCTSLTYRAQGPQPYRDSLPNGRALPQTRVYVLDECGHPVPHQVEGELYIGGPGVGLGYLNQPELTAQCFVPPTEGLLSVDSQVAEGLLYKTGDLARWLPDGQLEYLGRQDEQVKIRGFRIEPGEVDAQLLSYPGIERAVTLAEQVTEGHARLVSYVTLKGDMTGEMSDTEVLRASLQSRLPAYMVPAHIVTLTSFPLTPNGKVDRSVLAQQKINVPQESRYEAPEEGIEQALADIWKDTLDVELVGRFDNFFDLGGHSLLVIQLINNIRQNFDVDLPISDVFTSPCLVDLTERIIDQKLSEFDEVDVAELTDKVIDTSTLQD